MATAIDLRRSHVSKVFVPLPHSTTTDKKTFHVWFGDQRGCIQSGRECIRIKMATSQRQVQLTNLRDDVWEIFKGDECFWRQGSILRVSYSTLWFSAVAAHWASLDSGVNVVASAFDAGDGGSQTVQMEYAPLGADAHPL